MRRSLPLPALLALLAGAVVLTAQERPAGRYRKAATPETIARWKNDFLTKRSLVPSPPRPPASTATAVDFSGRYRFGNYSYDLVVEQQGDAVVFSSGGVDEQDIGGAFQTLGAGTVRAGRIHARWWCIDLSRNYANNGGAELWFQDEARTLLRVRYAHDADETVEEGYALREGVRPGERLDYRIRVPQPAKEYPEGIVVAGRVRGRGGETLHDAIVMVRHEEATAVRTDAEGRFALRLTNVPAVLLLSAASPGYRNACDAILFQEFRELEFVLDLVPAEDDPAYRFVDPTPHAGQEIWNCGNCHKNSYAEWTRSRHAQAARNPVTRALHERDFLPALAAGKAEGSPGLCASCHAPEAALQDPAARLDRVTGTALLGNHCDFCHKVHHVERIDAPGVAGSLRVARPSPQDDSVPGPLKRMFGALPDSDFLFMGAVYNPLFKTSVLCAGCHQHTTARGLPALDTYGEWLAWAAPQESARSCQECHMGTGLSMEGRSLAKRIAVNALRRPKEQIHHHGFVGREKAAEAVVLEVEARLAGGRLLVEAVVENRTAGHRVPTGTGDKHLLLAIIAADLEGRPYRLVDGPRVPTHAGGEGDPTRIDATELRRRMEAGEWANFAGREFAQVLADETGATHVPFWRATRVVEDTRLRPAAPVTTACAFEIPEQGAILVRVRLLHRLRFKAHDVAADVAPDPTRPFDFLVTERFVTVR